MNRNYFSTNFLDRISLKRNDESWIKSQIDKESTKIIPVWESKVLCQRERKEKPLFISSGDLDNYADLILLGKIENTTYFAININSAEYADTLGNNHNGQFIDLKQVATLLSFQDGSLLSLARFMVDWNTKHRFCGKCGSPAKSAEAGNLRICTDKNCNRNHFPSVDPAIIVLVSSGEKCLLASQEFWPKGMYSTIAGFVEPGENIEDAVVREVQEETGISVTDIKYQSSQPWLFPSSLMIGFTAQAKNETIIMNHDELKDVGWFSREEIKTIVLNGNMKLPSEISIAFKLIEKWYNLGEFGKLKDLI